MNQESFQVSWQCEKCGVTMTGFLRTGDPTARVCNSNTVRGKKGYPMRMKKAGLIVPYVCKGTMIVVLDERPPKLNVLVMERDPPLTARENAQELGGTSAWRKQRSV